jgi:hypothetical protein
VSTGAVSPSVISISFSTEKRSSRSAVVKLYGFGTFLPSFVLQKPCMMDRRIFAERRVTHSLYMCWVCRRPSDAVAWEIGTTAAFEPFTPQAPSPLPTQLKDVEISVALTDKADLRSIAESIESAICPLCKTEFVTDTDSPRYLIPKAAVPDNRRW